MANSYSRGRNYNDRSEGWGGRGRTEQQGYEEERWRRNQEWSPSQDTGYQTGGSSYGSPYGYGGSGMEDYGNEYNDNWGGGGSGDFRSFQGGNQYGYGASGQGRFGQYGSGEFNRREARQSRYSGGYGSQGGFGGGYGQGPQSYGEGRYETQGGQGQYGSQGNYGSEPGYGRSGDTGFQGGSQGGGFQSEQSGGYGSQGEYGSTSGQYGPQGGYGGQFGSQAGYGYGSRTGQSGQYGAQQQSGFRGRGPKGYTRSDQRIEEDINERLYDDYYLDASNIEVSVLNGTVTLSGEAEDRDAKRRAEDIAESCSGVQQVQNNIKVKSSLTGWLFGNGSDESESPGTSSRTSSTQSSTAGGTSSKKASSSGS